MIITRQSRLTRFSLAAEYTEATNTRVWQDQRRHANIETRAPAEMRLRIRKAQADAERTGYGCYIDPREPNRIHEIVRVTIPPMLVSQIFIPDNPHTVH